MNIKFQDYIGIFDNAASAELCDRVVASYEGAIATNPSASVAGALQFGYESERMDFSMFFNVDFPQLAKEINQVLDVCLARYMQEYFGLKTLSFYSHICKIQKTPPKGGYHVWHCEQQSMASSDRCLVWSVYLNDLPDGEGETEFLHQCLRIKPKKGTVCLFPAAWTHVHRGNLVMTENKYIATGWYSLK
jgi:hypothetical protein